jgi:hypothetical protein
MTWVVWMILLGLAWCFGVACGVIAILDADTRRKGRENQDD